MSPFEPIGKVARWRVIYDILTTLRVDDVVTYAQLAEQLGLDPDAEHDRRKIQMAMRRAAAEYSTQNRRALTVVTNKGYRVVEAHEHLDLADGQNRKAGRALARGHSYATNVDLNGLDHQTQQAFEAIARGFALQMDFNKRLMDRQNRTDQLLGELYGRVEDLERRSDSAERDVVRE
jgi:DNA phosphorothioation-dependent restriction protein DptG